MHHGIFRLYQYIQVVNKYRSVACLHSSKKLTMQQCHSDPAFRTMMQRPHRKYWAVSSGFIFRKPILSTRKLYKPEYKNKWKNNRMSLYEKIISGGKWLVHTISPITSQFPPQTHAKLECQITQCFGNPYTSDREASTAKKSLDSSVL
jgi:hypothetical protein